ncbi:MAG: hypothetical protein HUJ94_07865 [Bacteroidales bacterium]|nr:hypothetical protein [Bacteroidales bacterium]
MKTIRLIPAACVLALAVSCGENNLNPGGFHIDAEDMVLGSEGGSGDIKVMSDREWTAVASEPWVMVSPANGIGETAVSILVDTTLIKGERSSEVSFSVDGQLQKKFTVRQLGFGNIISVEKPEVKIEYFRTASERSFTAKVTSNIPFDAKVEDGSFVSVSPFESSFSAGSRPRSTTIKVSWQMNQNPESRTARISFVPREAGIELEQPAVLTVTQDAAPLIEDNRAGDSLAVVLINDMLGAMTKDDPSEKMTNWQNVALWSATDKELPCREAIGRIRAVRFYMFTTEEGIPDEIRHLKYLQTLDFYSNINYDRKSISLGTAICDLQYLKYLEIGAYGLVDLPAELVKLGSHLVTLNINSNCFSSVPDILTPQNFPALKSLNLATNRRISSLVDLRRASEYAYRGGIGLHINTEKDDRDLRRLLLWENLEELSLSFNCIEGSIPDFKPGQDGVRAWNDEDVKRWGGDTIQFLAANRIPRILPNARSIRLNLNFFTGKLPDWLLYHPRLIDMDPMTLIFNQQEGGRNSRGELVRFSNEPANYEYYFEAFPKMREKYTYNDVYED